MEADKLMSHVLKANGFEGNVGEQLKDAKLLFTSLDNVWTAHKLRNKIAHEVTHETSLKEYKNALSYFKQALQDLGAKI